MGHVIRQAAAAYFKSRKPGPDTLINIYTDGEPMQFSDIDEAAVMALENGYRYTVMIRDAVPIMLDLENHGQELAYERRRDEADEADYERSVSSLELAGRV
jgi:hypothetical protein